MFRQAPKRLFFRQQTATAAANDTSSKQRTRRVVLAVGAAATTGAIVSYKTRKWRNQHLTELPDWQEMYNSSPAYKNRTIQELTTTMKRAKLMGTVKQGVSQELEDIRKWHVDNGYKGGLVLRELNTPIFSHSNDDDSSSPEFELLDSMALARRECYYLYYEVKGNGHISQQIFCRGTTLGVDILTCLAFLWKYDNDLECNIHRGFLNHANHLLKDVLPLLAPPSDTRATIEVSGHSLGGAVAFLLAMKLKLMGYNVVKLTTIGAPRFCSAESASRLSTLLPQDTLRIEDDLDVVPFLPPFASHLGAKVWLVHGADGVGSDNGGDDKEQQRRDTCAKFVPFSLFPWTESVWINFRVYEVLSSFSKHHRVLHYASELLNLTTTTREAQEEDTVASTHDDWERP